MTQTRAIGLLIVLATAAGCSSGTGKFIAGPDLLPAGAAVDMAGAADLPPAYYLPSGTTLTPFLSPDAQHEFGMAEMVLDPQKHYYAVLDTDAGRIVLDLLAADTPITVNSFVFLARHHFFDGIAFHRVIDNFVAQAGDPLTIDQDPSLWGTGGPGYMFGVEIVSALKYDGAGVVGMARQTDPNTNGSQFFITLAATPNLDGKYTIFARVSEGLGVLPKIVRGQPPANPTRMQRVYITEKAK